MDYSSLVTILYPERFVHLASNKEDSVTWACMRGADLLSEIYFVKKSKYHKKNIEENCLI
jgi:hypothetical protein